MGLRPTDGDENRRIGAGSVRRLAASTCTVSALVWFFNGVGKNFLRWIHRRGDWRESHHAVYNGQELTCPRVPRHRQHPANPHINRRLGNSLGRGRQRDLLVAVWAINLE